MLILAYVVLVAATARILHPCGGGRMPQFVEPSITRSMVETWAHDPATRPSTDRNLITGIIAAARSMPVEAPGFVALSVGFGPPGNRRIEGWSVGWPLAWCNGLVFAQYRDATDAVGFRPVTTDQNLRPLGPFEAPPLGPTVPQRRLVALWSGQLVVQPPPEWTSGKVHQVFIHPLHFMAWFAVLALAVLIGRAAWRGLSRRGDARDPRRLSSLQRLLCLGGVVTLTLTVAWWSHESSTRVDSPTWAPIKQSGFPPSVFWTYERLHRLPMRLTDIEALRTQAEPGAIAALARAIVAAVPEGSAQPNDLLVIVATPESTCGYNDTVHALLLDSPWFPFAWVMKYRYLRSPEFGPVEVMPSPRGLRIAPRIPGFTQVSWSSGAGEGWIYSLDVRVGPILSLAAAWIMLTLILARCLDVLGARRRRRRLSAGLCPQCRFPLAPTAPTA